MIIGQIKNGIVLDHITAGNGMEVYQILGLESLDCTVALICNAESRKMGKKDIIKIDKAMDLDLDVLGYIDPGITVNVIKDGVRTKLDKLALPKTIKNLIVCKNPRCITSCEQELVQEFKLVNEEKKTYRCVYCDSEVSRK